jgi:hypothetical protein
VDSHRLSKFPISIGNIMNLNDLSQRHNLASTVTAAHATRAAGRRELLP